MSILTLELGQVLSEPVYVSNGRKLFSSGHTVTEQTLRILKIWGVHNNHQGRASLSAEEENAVFIDPSIFYDESFNAVKSLCINNDIESASLKAVIAKCMELSVLPDRSEDSFFAYLSSSLDTDMTEDQQRAVVESETSRAFYENEILPTRLYCAVDLLNDVYVTADDVVNMIAEDSVLESAVLNISKVLIELNDDNVASIYDCISFLGIRTVLYVSIVIVYIHYVKKRGVTNASLHYCRKAIATAVAARLIAKNVEIYSRDCFFANGAFLNIGTWFFYNKFFYKYALVRKKAVYGGNVAAIEREILGMDHAEFGAVIIKRHGFPYSLERNVAQHTESHSEHLTKDVAILLLAEAIGKALTYNPAYDVPMQRLEQEVWDLLQISESTLSSLVETVYHQSVQILELTNAESLFVSRG